MDESHAFRECIAIGDCASGLDRTVEVVNHRKQLADHAGNRNATCLGDALVGPLAVVLEVGFGAKRQVFELVTFEHGLSEFIEFFLDDLGVFSLGSRETVWLRRARRC